MGAPDPAEGLYHRECPCEGCFAQGFVGNLSGRVGKERELVCSSGILVELSAGNNEGQQT